MILFVFFIILIICAISTNTLSYRGVDYQVIYITSGDTLWNIAREEKSCNSYFKDKKIPQIVEELKEINDLSNGNLEVGEELKIPYWE